MAAQYSRTKALTLVSGAKSLVTGFLAPPPKAEAAVAVAPVLPLPLEAASVDSQAAAASSTISRTGPGMWTSLVLGAVCDATAAADAPPPEPGSSSRPTPVLQSRDLAGVLVAPRDWFYPIPNALALKAKEASEADAERAAAKKAFATKMSRAAHYWESSWQ